MTTGLRGYFNGLADILASRAYLGGDSVENADIGANREIICREFLEKHVPKRFSIRIGGDVFGVNSPRSGQIDILVNHDMSMNFLENHKIRCAVESLTAAIAVKSNLTKEEIFNALANLATIPQCHPSVVHLNPLAKPGDDYILSWPTLFMFAYSGVELQTCVNHMCTFYADNLVPFNRIPRAIIVNRKYILIFPHYQVPDATISTPFNPSFLKATEVVEATRGLPLFWMMHELGKGLSWLDGMYLDYEAYYNEAFLQ